MAYSPFRNLWLKLISIVIAAMLWLVVAGDRIVERIVRVPLEFQNLPSGLEIVTDIPDAIDVRLRGPSDTLAGITPVDAWTVLDLKTARRGRRLYNLTASQVNVPYGVEVVQINPGALSLEFENTAVRVVPVKPTLEGQPADGFEVTRMTVSPPAVEVVGPESALDRLEEASTEPISVTGSTRSIRESVTVGVFDPWVRLSSPQTADVAVDIAPLGAGLTLQGVRVHVRNLRAGLSTTPAPTVVSITVRGAPAALQALSAEGVSAYVEADGLGAGTHRLPVQVDAGPDYAASNIEPSSVTLTIRSR
ncbi:MAG: YbbR-like domain-containing protein [Vicinamibacterales bacterium]